MMNWKERSGYGIHVSVHRQPDPDFLALSKSTILRSKRLLESGDILRSNLHSLVDVIPYLCHNLWLPVVGSYLLSGGAL